MGGGVGLTKGLHIEATGTFSRGTLMACPRFCSRVRARPVLAPGMLCPTGACHAPPAGLGWFTVCTHRLLVLGCCCLHAPPARLESLNKGTTMAIDGRDRPCTKRGKRVLGSCLGLCLGIGLGLGLGTG
eukprot:354367-Chlamydomonas_euryale.AAC.5